MKKLAKFNMQFVVRVLNGLSMDLQTWLNGQHSRRGLDLKKDYPAPNNGVMDVNADPNMLGIYIVTHPEHLKAVIISQRLVVKIDDQVIKKLFRLSSNAF